MSAESTEAKKAFSRERERIRKREYNKRRYVPVGDIRSRCAICNTLMYGKGSAHAQCLVRQAESRVPE